MKIHWPTSDDFANTDDNDDGILTFEEVNDYMNAPINPRWIEAWKGKKFGRSAPLEPELLDRIELGFSLCNTDSGPGLTWSEIQNCQV